MKNRKILKKHRELSNFAQKWNADRISDIVPPIKQYNHGHLLFQSLQNMEETLQETKPQLLLQNY